MGVLPQGDAALHRLFPPTSSIRICATSALVGPGRRRRIGATLVSRRFQRFDYDFRAHPSCSRDIIAVVMVGEVLSGFMRRLFQ